MKIYLERIGAGSASVAPPAPKPKHLIDLTPLDGADQAPPPPAPVAKNSSSP